MTHFRFPWRRLLIGVVPALALLSACDSDNKPVETTHPVATYAPATWDDLPKVSDSDLQAGFAAWRSACQRLAKDPIWGATCAGAQSVDTSPAAIRAFLQAQLQVYGLRSAEKGEHGLITGYYEPVYSGSLKADAQHIRSPSTACRPT
ncbi:membrane-bound lytic murein transglycosylase [Pseudomonas sp. PvP001]